MTKATNISPMQQELLDRADSIFSGISSAVSTAKDFAVEQLPDIAYQFVAFGRFYESAVFALGLILFSVGMYLVVQLVVRNKSNCRGGNEVGYVIAGGFTSLVGVFNIFDTFKSFAMVWFAPKIWLVVEIVKLVK